MNYKITVDTTGTYYANIEADSPEEAYKMALKEAYEDSWSCTTIYAGADVYEMEDENGNEIDITEGAERWK